MMGGARQHTVVGILVLVGVGVGVAVAVGARSDTAVGHASRSVVTRGTRVVVQTASTTHTGERGALGHGVTVTGDVVHARVVDA